MLLGNLALILRTALLQLAPVVAAMFAFVSHDGAANTVTIHLDEASTALAAAVYAVVTGVAVLWRKYVVRRGGKT